MQAIKPARSRASGSPPAKVAKPRAPRRRDNAAVPTPQPRAAAFCPIRLPRISETIGERVRQQIAAGDLRPGDRLPTERELAEMFAVSRMAVREGLRNLELSGLIVLRKGRHGGAFVSNDSAKLVTQSIRDMIDLGRASLPMLTETRRHIMDAVVRLACQRATPQHFAALEANLATTEALTAEGRFAERTWTAIEFNRLLAEATGNHILCAIVAALSEVLRQFVELAGRRPHDPVLETRRKLIDELKAGDADAAAATMSHYLDGLEKHLMRTLRSSRKALAKWPSGWVPN
jgi:GntR family transcriptional repressor for pyruvate dehydrogenase complex